MEKLSRAIRVDLSAIAHATEDIEKVCLAVKSLLPRDFHDKVTFGRDHMTGHHGNPIVSLKATISDRTKAERLIKELAPRLSSLDRSLLLGELGRCVDSEGNLYLRFDKQAAYLGDVRFKQEDPIRIKVRFQGRLCTIEAIRTICKEMGLVD